MKIYIFFSKLLCCSQQMDRENKLCWFINWALKNGERKRSKRCWSQLTPINQKKNVKMFGLFQSLQSFIEFRILPVTIIIKIIAFWIENLSRWKTQISFALFFSNGSVSVSLTWDVDLCWDRRFSFELHNSFGRISRWDLMGILQIAWWTYHNFLMITIANNPIWLVKRN